MYIEQTVFLLNPVWEGGGYFTNFSVGTPPQAITASLDTTYGATFVQSANYTPCSTSYSFYSSCQDGAFNASSSSTVITVEADGFNYTGSLGSIISDVVQIGSLSVAGMQFGLSTTGYNLTGYATGVLGLGYSLNGLDSLATPDRGFLGQLSTAGLINSKLFSVFLGSTAGNQTGSLVFGGVDLSKYSGELVTLDILAQPYTTEDNTVINTAYQHVLAITDISVTAHNQSTFTVFQNGDSTGQQNGSLPAVHNTMQAWWEVSPDVYDSIVPFIPGLDASSQVIPCEGTDRNLTITITFGANVNITVPFNDLVIPIYDGTQDQTLTSDGLPLCSFALRPRDGNLTDPYYLGYSVLRSMYTVYDLDNAQMSIAQANSKCDGCSDIHEVPAGTDGLSQVLKSASRSLVTASANVAIATSLVSMEAGSNPTFSVWTASAALGQATGYDVIPGAFRTYGATIVATGTLTASMTPSIASSTSELTENSTTTSPTGTSSSVHRFCGAKRWLELVILECAIMLLL